MNSLLRRFSFGGALGRLGHLLLQRRQLLLQRGNLRSGRRAGSLQRSALALGGGAEGGKLSLHA